MKTRTNLNYIDGVVIGPYIYYGFDGMNTLAVSADVLLAEKREEQRWRMALDLNSSASSQNSLSQADPEQ